MGDYMYLTPSEREALQNDRLKRIEAAIYGLELDLKLTSLLPSNDQLVKGQQIEAQIAGCREAMKVLLEDGE